MDVVAQRVRTTWTKRSRGGPAASARNRVPIAFPLPAEAGLHEVDVDESTGFSPRFAVRPLAELDGVKLREVDGELSVLVLPSPGGGAAAGLATAAGPAPAGRVAALAVQPAVRLDLLEREGLELPAGDAQPGVRRPPGLLGQADPHGDRAR